jgi:hypothetical protein
MGHSIRYSIRSIVKHTTHVEIQALIMRLLKQIRWTPQVIFPIDIAIIRLVEEDKYIVRPPKSKSSLYVAEATDLLAIHLILSEIK